MQSVRTLNVQGKVKRFGSRQGRQSSYKKAYISSSYIKSVDDVKKIEKLPFPKVTTIFILNYHM